MSSWLNFTLVVAMAHFQFVLAGMQGSAIHSYGIGCMEFLLTLIIISCIGFSVQDPRSRLSQRRWQNGGPTWDRGDEGVSLLQMDLDSV
jgi:hypothetical protein